MPDRIRLIVADDEALARRLIRKYSAGCSGVDIVCECTDTTTLATALVDVLLFVLVGETLVCYRCGAEYRDLDSMAAHGPFSLETHERYRQQAARLAQARKSQEVAVERQS